MSTQQDIYAAGSESRPPMLNKENYVPWSSCLLRYAKSRLNGKLIHNSILNGPYVRRMIPEPGDANREVNVTETFHMQTDDELSEKELKQIEADDQVIHTILLGLPEDIYADKEVDELKSKRIAKTQDPLAFMANSNNPYAFLAPHQDQSSFNQNYLQQPMPNPEDITDPTTVMNMALVLMAKAFKLNYSTPTNSNQRISSNPRNRHIAQPGMNMGQDRQMQMVGGNGNQNQIGNANLVATRAEGNAPGQKGNQIRDAAYLQTQLLIAQKEEAGIQLQAEEYDLMAAAADLDEIEEVNANCILMVNLQQASTLGTQTDSAPVYDSDGSAKVHNYENCYDNEIFNMFTQEEQYTELLEPIPESHQVPQNNNDVISEDTSVEQGGETVEQHPANFEETRALYESLYQNLAIEIEKVNSVYRKLKETNADLITELVRFKNQKRCFEISQDKYDKLERCYQQSVYQEQCLSKKINVLHLSTGKQIMTLNEQISDLNKQLSKEKSIVSFLFEKKKKLKSDFKTCEDKLLDKQIQLEKKIKELNNILLKTGQSIQTIHMLSPKPDSFYHTKQKMALGYQNHFYLKQAQKKQQSLYDGKVLLEKHDPPVVHDSEETLQIAQESRDKMKQMNKEIKPASYTKINHLSGVFVPQTALSREELYFSNNSKTANVSKSFSIPNEDLSDDTTPSVARKFLNEVKSTIVTLQRVVKLRMTIETHNWASCSHQELHKIIREEFFPIVNQVEARVQNFKIQFLKEAAKFVGDFKSLANEADATLVKHKALELEIERLLKAVVSQDIKSVVQNASVVDTSVLQTELEQLEFQVLNYAKENAHLKATYKNLFDSISVSQTQTKPIIASFQNELQCTIYKNAKLRTQLFKKVYDQKDNAHDTSENTKFAKQPIVEIFPKVGETNALSKPVTSNSVSTPQESKGMNNDKVIAPGMFRINPDKASREAKNVPNPVRASNRIKSITVSQPPVFIKKDDVISNVVCAMCKKCLISVNHDDCLCNYVNDKNSCGKKQKAKVSVKEIQKKYQPKVTKPKKVIQICLWCVDSGCFKHMTGNLRLLVNFVWKFMGTVRFENDHVAAIMGFGQFCDSDLEVVFRRNACFVRNLEGVDLLKGDRSTNLYTINLNEMASASPICLMARASSTKSWLWHQRLSHLNFDTVNDLARNDLVSGLPKFKYHKEHICPSCEQGKSKRASHPPKPVPNSRQRLHLLHMNLCGPMRIASINGKRTKKIMETMNVLFDELSTMTFEQRNSKPGLQSMTSGQISSGLDLSYAPSIVITQQPTEGELDLLFEAMYDDYIGGQPSATARTVPPAQEPQLNSNAMVDGNTFVNPFANSSTSAAASSSSQNVDPSNMHTFYQPYPYEFQWTKDHPLEQVIGVPSRPVLTRNQLRSDGDMCMYALTVSTMEPKNVKEAMTDPAWIDSMQKELLQFKRLDVWVLVPALDNILPLTLKWLFKNKHDEEKRSSETSLVLS
nr:hypothetical protein [Tanacetum cinerariifolium]